MTDTGTTLDLQRASAASDKLRLRAVGPIGIEAKALNFPSEDPLSFNLAHQPAFWHVLQGVVICTFGVDVEIVSRKQGTEAVLARLSLVFRSEYDLLPSFVVGTDEELLQHYVGIVGRLHWWPYLRQEVQSLTTKLGFPPLTLPVLVSGHMVALPTAKWIDPSLPAKPIESVASVPRLRRAKAKKKASRSATKSKTHPKKSAKRA